MTAPTAIRMKLGLTTLGTVLVAAGALVLLVGAATGPLYRARGAAGPALIGAIVIGLCALLFVATPRVLDWHHRRGLGASALPPEQLQAQRPALAAALSRLCEQSALPLPEVLLLPSDEPQAYCYGHRLARARLVLSRGLLLTLDERELEAVVAHEVGHLAHRDVVVMTAGAAVLVVLWTAHVTTRVFRGRSALVLLPFSLLALALFLLTRFVLLALSRTREYAADAFAAENTSAEALASALVKVSAAPGTGGARPLDGALGLLGFARSGGGKAAIDRAELSLELHSPWARLAELVSTHPRLAARLSALAEQARASGRPMPAELTPEDDEGPRRSRLYLAFAADLSVALCPALASGGAGLYAYLHLPSAGYFSLRVVAGAGLSGLGAGLLLGSLYALAVGRFRRGVRAALGRPIGGSWLRLRWAIVLSLAMMAAGAALVVGGLSTLSRMGLL